MIVLQGLLWLLLAVVLAVILVLALPVRLRLLAQSEPELWARMELGLFGGALPNFSVFNSAQRRQRVKTEVSASSEALSQSQPKKRTAIGKKSDRGMRVLRAAPRLLGGLLRRMKIERCDLDCRFGLGDPAETGQIYGLVAPVAYGSGMLFGQDNHVSVEPVFDRACLEGRVDVTVAAIPFRLLVPALKFGWAVFGPRR
ncbi:DUF2953 domain-containing protein [Pseudoruegeria sp. HB172150]|uniref:DUF2953 domain-containing protein n=1 Tax=Pseudoruegeria sp. HB172150 TaxID=2721164 RepID=UPI0015552F8E|nr:DUF2953 domain-containing protein [Pseudoruegeria sp. HB172150]